MNKTDFDEISASITGPLADLEHQLDEIDSLREMALSSYGHAKVHGPRKSLDAAERDLAELRAREDLLREGVAALQHQAEVERRAQGVRILEESALPDFEHFKRQREEQAGKAEAAMRVALAEVSKLDDLTRKAANAKWRIECVAQVHNLDYVKWIRPDYCTLDCSMYPELDLPTLPGSLLEAKRALRRAIKPKEAYRG